MAGFSAPNSKSAALGEWALGSKRGANQKHLGRQTCDLPPLGSLSVRKSTSFAFAPEMELRQDLNEGYLETSFDVYIRETVTLPMSACGRSVLTVMRRL